MMDRPSMANVRRIDLGCLPMLNTMHQVGIRADVPHFQALGRKLTAALGEIDFDIATLVGGDMPGFKPTSPMQVAELLFGRYKLKPPGRQRITKSGWGTTADETLSSIENQHPIVGRILDHRELSKLLSTYVLPMPLMVDADGRLRTIFKPTRTRTGRLSSGDRKQGKPNLQNIPTRGDWGAEVRNGFLARPGYVLVSLDLSQIEMRLAAHMSGDEAMIRVFLQGLDIHNQTAIAMFQLEASRILYLARLDAREELEKCKLMSDSERSEWKSFKHTYRLPAKTLGFGVLYGVSDIGLQGQILAAKGPLLTQAECTDYIERWFAAYPLIRVWMYLQYSRARRFGMTWTAFGRPRLIAEARSVLEEKQGAGDREAGNHGIQGTAADMLKIDMAELGPVVDHFNYISPDSVWPLLQIHDELIFECRKDVAGEFAAWGREVMRTAVPLVVPVDSSADMAERWGQLK